MCEPLPPRGPDWRTALAARARRRLAVRAPGTARANMITIAVAYAVFAVSLVFQPQRWARTPAYHNLLELLPAQGWAVLFAAAAAGLAAGVAQHRRRWVAVTALTAGIVLTTCWGGAFVVRWLTSASTTPETWVSWAVFDLLLVRAVAMLDYEEVRVPAGRETRRDG